MAFKSADIKKDARLTIRVPRRLKDRLAGIERVYGVGLPKIANEYLMIEVGSNSQLGCAISHPRIWGGPRVSNRYSCIFWELEVRVRIP